MKLHLVPPPDPAAPTPEEVDSMRPAARVIRDAGMSFEEAARNMGVALGKIGATMAAGANAMMEGFVNAMTDPTVLAWADRLEFETIAVRSRWRVFLSMLTLS